MEGVIATWQTPRLESKCFGEVVWLRSRSRGKSSEGSDKGFGLGIGELVYNLLQDTCRDLDRGQLLTTTDEMDVVRPHSIVINCDNHAAMYIINNLVFNKMTNYIEVDCHFIKNMVLGKSTSLLILWSANWRYLYQIFV